MLFILLFNCLIHLLMNLQLINGSKIGCDFKTYPLIGCSQESQSICNNDTGFCECKRLGFPVNFDDKYCLPLKNIDEKCFISDQCLKTSNHKLLCFYLDSNPLQLNNSLIELNKSDAIKVFQLTDRRLEGFCKCDQNYYYDYENNRCLHLNQTSIGDPFNIDINELNVRPNSRLLFDCSLDIECKTFDEYSYCDINNRMCVCNHGFVKDVNNRCSQIKSLNEKCSHFDQCIDRNSYCNKESNICVCSKGFSPDLQNQICYKSRSLYEECNEDRECNFQFGSCDQKRSVCVCDQRSITLGTFSGISLCVKKTFYGDVCNSYYGDIVCQSSAEHLVCSKYTNRCVCEDGFVFRGDKCKTYNINRYGFEDEFVESEPKKNPMTYILIVFCSVFGFTIFASILIKLTRRRYTPSTHLALYANNRQLNQVDRDNTDRPPSAPPVYSLSRNSIQLTFTDSSLTIDSRNNVNDNEDKPPSYEEAIAGYVIL